MSDHLQQEVIVLNEALGLNPPERAAFLDKACAGNEALRRRVEALLRAHDDAPDFLHAPASGLVVQRDSHSNLRLTEKPGDRIGRYKLLQQLGEGGCGVVYMAEQEEPVRRKVALKVIKLGMDTKQVVARFEAERQALALMDHPNIAKVLDAGSTETGRPFFVMELVHGTKITDFCDQNCLSIRERLELFELVCGAVQHAHQKGVIHRDLKPSNVLVTSRDGVPVPKVIDFGIAKATTGQPLTDKTLFTAFEQFMGTPAYMSPEQAELSELGVDTRSDIYSLGVLLYELLTGQTPFDTKELLAKGFAEMRRTIREVEPVKPSTRLTQTAKSEFRNPNSEINSPLLTPHSTIPSDLDWIVMKCLEKDRSRRYETADGLALDVQHYLKNEPITARPSGRLYRFGKMARRNKLLFAAIGATAAAVILGLVLSMWLLVNEQRARRTESRLRHEAVVAAARSQQVEEFMTDMLKGAGPLYAQGLDTTLLRRILDDTERRLAFELKDQPEVQAQLLSRIGEVYFSFAEYEKAETIIREALRLQESISAKDSQSTIQARISLAMVLRSRGKLLEAEQLSQEALQSAEKTLGPSSPEAAGALNFLAMTLYSRAQLPGAEALFRKALERNRRLMAEATAANKEQRVESLAISLDTLAQVRLDRWDPDEAETLEREALSVVTNSFQEPHPNVAWALNNLAGVLRQRGSLPQAEELQSKSLALIRKVVPESHPHVNLARNNLAIILRRRAAPVSDLSALREALALDPPDQLTADALAASLAKASLGPAELPRTTNPGAWKYTSLPPGPNWAAPDFDDASWSVSESVSGSPTYVPRTNRTPPPSLSLTNLWFRREFELPQVPPGKLAFRINCNHDAEIFINGVQAAPVADWSDTEILIPASAAGRAALKSGRNTLAVRCQDADGGTPIDVQLFFTPDTSLGRKQVIQELTQMLDREPLRAAAGRASAYARLAEWHDATAELRKTIELKPTEHTLWYQLAPLLLQTGDLAGYQQLRQDTLKRFSRPDDPTMSARISRVLLLLPAGTNELKSAVALADEAAVAEYADTGLALRQFAKGLAEYRQGHAAEAIAWMNKLQITGKNQQLPGWTHARERNRVAMALLVQAMACLQIGQKDEAGAAFNQATALIQNQFPAENSGDIGVEWPDWLTVMLLKREVNGLFNRGQ